MKIAVVIVNYRTAGLVVDCLASLAEERADDLPLHAFVGDAASGDGSVEQIRAAIEDRGWSDWATCDDLGENGGFAWGNNRVTETRVLTDPDVTHIHYLNPDAYIRPGAVRALVDFLDAHPKAGVAGSRLENPDGSLRAYAFRWPRPWREFFRAARQGVLDRAVPSAAITIEGLTETRRVDWVTGASFMVRRAVLDRIGLMDDEYFLYYEETDFQRAVAAAGFEIWHVSESRVVHLGGQATGTGRRAGPRPPLSPIAVASRRRYFRKHHGPLGVVVADMAYLAGDLVCRAMFLARLKPTDSPPHLWRSLLSGGTPGRPDP